MRLLLTSLGERFPSLQKVYKSRLENLITEFNQPTVEEFLDAHTDSVDQFSKDFPTIYELFVRPLLKSPSHKGQKLFNFYCNPYIFNPIMEVLAKQDSTHRFSEGHLRLLEKCLKTIRPHTKDSWKELVNKSRELLKASNDLEAFAAQCSGLRGEIKAAFYLVKNVCHPGDALIFLEDDNRNCKKDKEKTCDLMVIPFEGGDRIPVEVKTKSPRHGVDEANACKLDDFFSTFSQSISSYLDYLDYKLDPIFGLSRRQCFRQFFAHEYSGYGTVLPLVNHTITSCQHTSDNHASKWTSEKKIETLLRALFMDPLVLEPDCVPLASCDARLSERRQSTESVCQKEWVRNIMQEGVKQLQKTCERLKQEGHRVPKLYLVLNLTLSYRLLQDPFSRNDGNMQDLAAEKLKEIFQPFKDEFSEKGLDLELLLP